MSRTIPFKTQRKIILNDIIQQKLEGNKDKVKELKLKLTELNRSRHTKGY